MFRRSALFSHIFTLLTMPLLFAMGMAASAQQPTPAQIYNFSVMARTGQVVDGLTVKNFAMSSGFYVVLNNKGQAAFKGETNKGNAIFRYTPATSQHGEKLEVVACTGDVQNNRQIADVDNPAINSQGHVSYIATYRNDGKVEADPSVDHLIDTTLAKLTAQMGGKEPSNNQELNQMIVALKPALMEAIARRKLTTEIATDKHPVYGSIRKLVKANVVPFAEYYDGQDHLVVPLLKIDPTKRGTPTAPSLALVDGKLDVDYASRLKGFDPQILRWFYNDKGQVITGGPATKGMGLPTGQQVSNATHIVAINQSGKIFADIGSRFYILNYADLLAQPHDTVYAEKIPGSTVIVSPEGNSAPIGSYPNLAKTLGVNNATTYFITGDLSDGGNHMIAATFFARHSRGYGGDINARQQIAFPVRYYEHYRVFSSHNLSEQAVILGTPGKLFPELAIVKPESGPVTDQSNDADKTPTVSLQAATTNGKASAIDWTFTFTPDTPNDGTRPPVKIPPMTLSSSECVDQAYLFKLTSLTDVTGGKLEIKAETTINDVPLTDTVTVTLGCPRYREMLASAKEIEQLADTWETDESAYYSAVTQMIFTGYRSPHAAWALDVSQNDIPGFFKDDLAIRANRSILIAHLRTKAANRKRFAQMGITQKYGQGVYAKGNVELFCSLDSSKFTKEFWDALWMAGYIDYDLYNQVEDQMIVLGYKNYFDNLAQLALLPITDIALSKYVLPFGAKLLSFSGIQLTTIRSLAAKTLPTFATRSTVTLSEYTADCFTNKIYTNRLTNTAEEFYRYHGTTNKGKTIVVWLSKTKYKSVKEVRDALAIKEEWAPTINEISTIRVPKNTWISEGFAKKQGIYPGEGYQAVILNIDPSWIIDTQPFP